MRKNDTRTRKDLEKKWREEYRLLGFMDGDEIYLAARKAAQVEIESEITTLKQRESKLVEALRLLEQVSTAPKNGKISLELYREKAREVLKELG